MLRLPSVIALLPILFQWGRKTNGLKVLGWVTVVLIATLRGEKLIH